MQQQSLTPEGDAAYWSLRYTIRRGFTEGVEFDVPVFLESSMDAILVTGAAVIATSVPPLVLCWEG